METPDLEVNACQIEFLNSDGSYVVTVAYRTIQGQPWPVVDRFSFSTAAKLKKFISKNLLGSPEKEELEEPVSRESGSL